MSWLFASGGQDIGASSLSLAKTEKFSAIIIVIFLSAFSALPSFSSLSGTLMTLP